MKENDGILSTAGLLAHISKHTTLLEDAFREIEAAEKTDVPLLKKSPRAGVLVAGLLENYYTCAETIFVRISQFFENHLTPDRWHRDLLERMTWEMEKIRPRLLSEETYRDLLELMRFRHFRRYYFGTAYDWDRLDELLLRVKRLHKTFRRELEAFTDFLRVLGA